jgi:uncharacterized protein YfiM (DUF2279 family)
VTFAPVFLLWLLQANAPALREQPLRTVPCAGVCSAPLFARVPQPISDRWFAEDKMRHLAMAFATTSFGHAAARAAGADAGTATALGAAATVVASIGKEVFDRRAGGIFSYRDLVWDAAGILLGVALVGNAR